jgi:hypothetical protein
LAYVVATLRRPDVRMGLHDGDFRKQAGGV